MPPEEIIYPSIDLFLYDLKNGLGQDDSKVNANCKAFCRKFYGDLDPPAFQKEYEELQKSKFSEQEVVELLGKNRFRELPESVNDGYYYPVQLGDTYALHVNYSGKLDANNNPNDKPQEIDDKPFEKLQQNIIKDFLDGEGGTIGQTWLIWGKLTAPKNSNEVKVIAKDCYTQVVTSDRHWDRDLISSGKLLDGDLFELWYVPSSLDFDWPKPPNPGEPPQEVNKESTGEKFWNEFRKTSYHVLIWLFPDNISPDEMRAQVQSVYEDFLYLLHYHHKIVWAYYQSRYQKAKLKHEFVEVQKSITQGRKLSAEMKADKLNLKDLRDSLTETLTNLSDYTIELNFLDHQYRTIKINLQNYQDRIAEINRQFASSNILTEFGSSDIYAPKYLRQVEADLANLNPGISVLQNLANTINGIIEIEQTKSDRNLNKTIAIASAGLATSGVTATILSTKIPEHKISVKETFFWSFTSGIVIALIVTGLTRFLPRS